MAELRLTEAEALARCDEIGLTQGRPREVYALYLATLWKARQLSEFLGISADNVYQAMSRAEKAVKAHEEAMAEKRWEQHAGAIPRGTPVDAFGQLGIDDVDISIGRTLAELIENVGRTGQGPNPMRALKDGATVHVGSGVIRGKRLSPECWAQIHAGTMGGRKRDLFTQ